MNRYDVIVVGLGGMGSAALYHLAKRGLAVLGIEQFTIAHDRGSSHGQTRILRKAYFEHPDYVPLLHRTYTLWNQLEAACGRTLYQRTGLLLVGPPDAAVISGVKRAAAEHHLVMESVSVEDFTRRFPAFTSKPDCEALFERDAGFLYVEDCVRAHVELARLHGASIVIGEAVHHWSADAHGVTVQINGGQYDAGALVICAGAWTGPLLQTLGLPLEIRRKVVFWHEMTNGNYRLEAGCPVFGFETREGFFYGFPSIDGRLIKLGHHTGGEIVAQASQVDRSLHPIDRAPVERFVATHLPGVKATSSEHDVCLYTMTPDEHFILDRHRDYPHVVYAAGFSGHGFKFAPIVGSVLADLVTVGNTEEPVAFLSASRPALRP